jgi:lipopolysaccharide/colanic/teichoic acid biosynthesis glycosyltransferase
MGSLIPEIFTSFLRNMYFRNLRNMGFQTDFAPSELFPKVRAGHRTLLFPEPWFNRMLILELKRTERSRMPFLLLSINMANSHIDLGNDFKLVDAIVNTLVPVTRDTDMVGWRKANRVIGVIFTNVASLTTPELAVQPIRSKIVEALTEQLGTAATDALELSFQIFPEQPPYKDDDSNGDRYANLLESARSGWLESRGKRAMDIGGSLLALIILLPLLLLLAIVVKLTSEGPVLFQQERIGRHGVPFTFLKFRSMHVGNDSRIHQEYVARYIGGDNAISHQGVYKVTNDPRITRVGKFLRKSSLDELPQFWNVLRGDMSLVGPRPPVRYEFQSYDLWHLRRVLEAKPGITGLWQVGGRSKTTFDDMVRLDLRYTRTSSFLLDLKILMRTPRVVLLGEGAY